MDLVRQNWDNNDITEYCQYTEGLKGDKQNCMWEQRIVNTQLECFARTSTKARAIAKEIKKGNFIKFIENVEIKNHLDSLVKAFLICGIKDFELFEKLLSKYVETIDNWASCDTLKFDKQDKEKLLTLSHKFLSSNKPFVRRVGVNIFFDLIKDQKYIDDALKTLNLLKNETEYYVNMCGAWLFSECFAKYRDKTLQFLKDNKTNAFIINKGISKCRDSYRVSKEDKEMLLNYKIK